ncbi:MDR family MFS transporter [Bifidobacterium aquikefiri]|uniref:MFS transporter n=1 Tax=Bifidobacterium aquikefiri TaxID=1653207 RepID=A0A261G323_9BIFI|nr:MDR family MFS transporter [Bifidobacterium aquikefiri]OZG65827.1 MFS transporter [Bifidobacterium aquikefiri]
MRARWHGPMETVTGSKAFAHGKLTRPALISISILTFITFVGNFTQLQLTSALPTMVREFNISVTTGQWMTSIFQLVMGVMIPLTAFLTKRFTTREIVIASMAIFTTGSLLSWLSPSFILVLAGRTLEAVGTGVMWPVLQITVFSIYPLAKRGVAMGTVGLAMSVAPALGPTLGGLQTDSHGWRSIFFSLTILGAICMIVSMFWLRNFGSRNEKMHADFFSASLSVVGFGGLLFGFTNIQAYSIESPMTWLPMIIGIAGIIWFVLRQMHLTAPLLDLAVFRNRGFTIGTIAASLSFFAFSSIMVIMPLYIQTDRGYSATMSGLIMLPGALGMAIAQFFGGRSLDRFGARPVAITGSLVLTLGTIGMSLVGLDTWIWWVSICQFVRQVGMGFVLMPITTWALNCLEPEEVSAGSAVTNTVRQLAGAMGAPVLVILMESFVAARRSAMGGGASTAVPASIFGIDWILRVSSLICVAMFILIFLGVKGDGAGSGRAMARVALRKMRIVHLPDLHSAPIVHSIEEFSEKHVISHVPYLSHVSKDDAA